MIFQFVDQRVFNVIQVRFFASLALVLTVVISLTACSSAKNTPDEKMQAAFADVREEVQSEVGDQERAAEAEALIVRLEETYAATIRSIRSRKAVLVELNADYDTERTAMAEQVDLILADLAANQKQVLAIRSQLHSVLTPEELEAIGKARSQALQAAMRAIDAL